MTHKKTITRLESGIPHFDDLIGGGLPKQSITILAGPPGSGKTTLAQQICFHNASSTNRVLYFNTLSEPVAKVLRYVSLFDFFDADKVESGIQFIDVGSTLATEGIEAAASQIMEQVRRVKPALVVIDSFKVFDDFAATSEALRKFTYLLAVNLMAWETTVLLVGEFENSEIQSNPVFSIIDGQILLSQTTKFDERIRVLSVVKLRGTAHSRDDHAFSITQAGIEIFAPRVTILREDRGSLVGRMKTGVSKFDDLLGEGIPFGSSVLVSGVAGTGKTILLLEFIFQGARMGEKGILFSFEETTERLQAAARAFGWDLEAEVKRGMLEVVFVPQPAIMVERDMLMMATRIHALQAKRVAIDSVSVFLYKLRDPQAAREKIFQLASIVQNAQSVGFFATDIEYGSSSISRFGVEETVVDGVILLTSTAEGLERQRYLEVYKLRQTAHLKGRHSIVIGKEGVEVFPRYSEEVAPSRPPKALGSERLSSGVPGLDALIGGGFLLRSATLVSGPVGAGKSTLGLQFIAAGVALKEPGLFISMDAGPEQIGRSAEALGFRWQQAADAGLFRSTYLSPENVRTSQFFSIIGDQIRLQGTRRLVLDGVGYLNNLNMASDELREMLLVLVSQFKLLDVTIVLLSEADGLKSSETLPDSSFVAVADNLLALAYEFSLGAYRPCLTVIKAHESAHDRGRYYYTLDGSGIQIGPRVGTEPPDA